MDGELYEGVSKFWKVSGDKLVTGYYLLKSNIRVLFNGFIAEMSYEEP